MEGERVHPVADIEEGRVPPASASVVVKGDNLQTARLENYRKSIAAQDEDPLLSKNKSAVKDSTAGVQRLKFLPLATTCGVLSSVAMLVVVGVSCPRHSSMASFVVALTTSIAALFISLPLYCSELRQIQSTTAKRNCVVNYIVNLRLEVYIVFYSCLALCSLLYFFEDELGLAITSLTYTVCAALFFFAWGEVLHKKRRSKA
eukprot:Lankesteria_metandrocarpae@DN6057_c0_g1_i1.p1